MSQPLSGTTEDMLEKCMPGPCAEIVPADFGRSAEGDIEQRLAAERVRQVASLNYIREHIVPHQLTAKSIKTAEDQL